MNTSDHTEERYLRLPEVMQRTGLSQPTIWRLEKAGRFPARVKIAVRAVAWKQSEIDAWMANRPAA